MIDSNINIKSNIYIRSNPEIKKDIKYTEKITGPNRIRLIKNKFIGFERIDFNEIQLKIASDSAPCAYAKNGEASFGPILANGSLQWVNRCEYDKCHKFEECCAERDLRTIKREKIAEEDTEEKENLKKFFEKLGIEILPDKVNFKRDKNQIQIETETKNYIAPLEQPIKEAQQQISRYTEITEPDCIINAELNSHIILNSGPGTGKTYTIIQRLIHILRKNLCPAEKIYILCYTRSAKRIIESKIENAVTKGLIEPSANNICVLTFDSYATYFLMAMKEQGIINENFSGYDYNARIKLFNKYISAEDFEDISYFIVDEIQDLVNERAEMVLNILKYLKCGYLLAGDRCQSIYDYEADEDATLDSVKFYELAEKQFPDDIQRYEIAVNRRQSTDLASEAAKMRQVLLNDSFYNQNIYANTIMKKYSENINIEKYIKTTQPKISVPTAILCRNNGEAEYISGLLCANGIRHTLNRGVNNTVYLPRWIADVFWDYCRENISRKDFIERFAFRCSFNRDPEILWEHFCKMTKSQDKEIISLSKLTSALSVINDIPNDFYEDEPLLTVSTIHKAKGSEFDRVILIESDIKPNDISAEEARVRYVALTRPKHQLITMKKSNNYFKRTVSGRVIETGRHNYYQSKNIYCKGITVGLNGDIDNTYFVSGDFENSVDLQEYIISDINIYDKLTAVRSPSTELYNIMHNGKCIGSLSNQMCDEIIMGVEATNYKYNLPDKLENLYVSNITAEILRKFNNNVPAEFQKSKICFGIRITGLARLKFEKK